MRVPATVDMPIDQVRQLSERQRVEFVVYQVRQAGFDSIGDAFLAQLRTIPNRHQEGSNAACTILQSPLLGGVCKIMEKDQRFNSYVTTYAQNRIGKEMRKLSLNPRLKMPAAEVTPERFKSFSFITINKEHKKNAPFTRMLLRACIDSDTGIVTNPDVDFANEIPSLRDEMDINQILKDRITPKRNRALVAVVCLSMLCYARNERSNIVQRVNGQFAFANNVPKRFVEAFHQMGMIVSYESIRRGLNINAKAVMDTIVDKTRTCRFFISYDNMNVYEHSRDQRIHNRSVLLNYTAGYVCFMKTPGSADDSNDTWAERYIDAHQIDRTLVNKLTCEDFELRAEDISHRSAVVRYSISEVLSQFFSGAMNKQKNSHNRPLYTKWRSPLPDIKCKNEASNILPLPTLPYNEGNISETIEVLRDIAKRLELTDDVVKDKIILLKGDLMTVRNCRRAIYRWQDELRPTARFHWIEPVAGLFHLQINVLALFFDKFWGTTGNIVGLDRFNGILKRKHITRAALTKNFHHSDDFFRTVIEALVVCLCMHVAGCQTIDQFQDWIGSSDWPTLIAKVESEYFGIFKVHTIRTGASRRTKNAVAIALAERKEEWANTIPLPSEPNWIATEKQLLSEFSQKHRDVIRENALLLLSCGLLYLDFVDACRKGYSGRVEKCIACLAVIYQDSNSKNYSAKLLHMVACLKKPWKKDLR